MEGVVVEAEVVSGNKLGRKLGFPTANMQVSPEKMKIKLLDEKWGRRYNVFAIRFYYMPIFFYY